jgi:type III secretion system YscD/HrpQ family protein
MEKSIQEIRILSGLQAGASLALSPGEYLLGTSEQCDIVLNDRQMMAKHARLIINEQGITIHGEEGIIFTLAEKPHDGPIGLGELFRAGHTWLVVEEADAAWPDVEAIFSEMKPAKLAPAGVEGSQEETGEPGFSNLDSLNEETGIDQAAAEAPFTAEKDVTSSPIEHGALMRNASFLRQHALKGIAVAAVLGIAVLCIVLALTPSIPDNKLLAQQASSENKRRIEQLLQNMHLRQRVSVAENKQGKLVVSGYLAKAQDITALMDALVKLNIRPELRLFSEETIVNAANQILLAAQLPIKATNLGMGRIQLIGAAANYENIDALMQKMNTSIDGLRGIDSEILVGDQLVAKLRQMIVDNGLAGKVALTINKGEAVVNGALDMREMAQWEQLMAQFVSTYGNILPIRASFPPTANMLPFKVLSAFSGEMPFIVTDRGEKVMLGGHIKGYTLVNITEQEIVFDGPRKVQIQR